jgi:hypothetical protein
MAAPSRPSAGVSDDYSHHQDSETSAVPVPIVARPLADDLLADHEVDAFPLPSSLLQPSQLQPPVSDHSSALFDADEASVSILALQHRVALLKAIT